MTVPGIRAPQILQPRVSVLSGLEEDGFGLVLPQATACELPVICTTNTGGEDMVRDGQDGFIVPIRDVEALIERIPFYTNRDACKEMRYSAQQRVKSGYTWVDYGNRMIGEYKRILG